MPDLGALLRRAWQPDIPDDRDDARQRRLLADELGKWRAKHGAAATLRRTRPEPPEPEGPVDLRRIARGFAPPEGALGREVATEAMRSGGIPDIGALRERRGAERAEQFQRGIERVPEEDREKLRAIARVSEERGLPFGELANRIQRGSLGTATPEERREAEEIKAHLRQRTEREPERSPSLLADVQETLEAEREFFRPVTEPIGRAAAELPIQLARARTGEKRPEAEAQAREITGELATETLVPSNFIPIPVVDDLAKIAFRAGPRVFNIARRLAGRPGSEAAIREAAGLAERGSDDAAEALLRQTEEAAPEVAPAPAAPSRAGAAPQPQIIEPEAPQPDLWEGPSGLRNVAIYDRRAGRVVYPSELGEAIAERERGIQYNFESDKFGAGHDTLMEFQAARRGDQESLENIFNTEAIHINRSGDDLTLRYDPDGYRRQHGEITESQYHRDIDRAVKQLRTDFPSATIRIPETKDVLVPRSPEAPAASGLTPAAEPGAAPTTPPPAGAAPIEPAAVSGGAPLTPQRLAERGGHAAETRDLFIANPGREARDIHRRWAGARNNSNLTRTTWQLARYKEAKEAGVNIVRRATSANATPDEVDMMERIWGAIDPSTGRTARGSVGIFRPEQRGLAQNLYDRVDAATQRLIEADPDFAPRALPEYMPHLFTKTKATAPRAGYPRGLTTRPGFTRRRKLEGMLGDILNDRPDLDLATWDPIDLVARHEAAVDNYIASLEAIRVMRAKGLVVPASAAPSSWRTPNVSPFKIRQQLDGWVAEPKVATTLEHMFGDSAFDQYGALRVAKGARNVLFKAKTFGGLFQQVDYSLRALGLGTSEAARAAVDFATLRPTAARGAAAGAVRAWFSIPKAIGRSVLPGVDEAALRAAERNPKMRALYQNGIGANVDPSLADQAIRGLGNIVPQSVRGQQIPGARGMAEVLDFVGGDMYRRFHQEMLEQAGLVNLEKQLRRGVAMDEAARLAVEETNVFFSSIPNWQSAVKSATGRDIFRFAAFAPGELEGWFRIPVQAPAGFAGIVGATVILAEMLNKASTGEWLSREQLEPYSREGLAELGRDPRAALGFGGSGLYNTKFLRPELPWRGENGRRLYLDILGQADSPFRWALDPMFATKTRLGQFPRAGMDVAAINYGKAPAFGEPVESPSDLARFAAQQVAPIGVSGLAGTERGRIGLVGAGVQASGVNISAQARGERFRDLYREQHEGRDPEPGISPRDLDPELARQAGYPETTEFQEERAELASEEERFLADAARIAQRNPNEAMEQFETELGDYFRFRSGVTEALVAQLGLPEREASLAQQYYELDPRTKRDETTGKPDWDYFETQRERLLRQIAREDPNAAQRLREGRDVKFSDPALQRVYDAHQQLKDGLDPYYDIEAEARGGSARRERFRRDHPAIDAQLYLLGRVSRVITYDAQTQVGQLSQRLLGTRVTAGRGEQRGRVTPIQIGGREPIRLGR